jgi:hypothetical protein
MCHYPQSPVLGVSPEDAPAALATAHRRRGRCLQDRDIAAGRS